MKTIAGLTLFLLLPSGPVYCQADVPENEETADIYVDAGPSSCPN